MSKSCFPSPRGVSRSTSDVLALLLVVASPAAFAVDLDASPAAPALYAEEIVASVASPVTLANVANGLDLSTPLGYSFTQGEVRHARVACPGHVRFLAGATVVPSDAPSTSIGAINGLGSSVITFSVTALTTGLASNDRLTITGGREITEALEAQCSFALYDTPSQASTGGPVGRIVELSGDYLDFGPSFALRAETTGRATADAESGDGPYTRFVVEAPTNDPTLGQLGRFSYGTVQDVLGTPQPRAASGLPITLADLMDADTALVVSGDFEAAANAFLSTAADCSTVDFPATVADSENARFPVGTAATPGVHLCYSASVGEVQASDYAVSLEPVAASAAYTVAARGPETLGSIVRNGTELMAPLVQPGPGQIARVVLTNSGADKRRFTLRMLSSAGGSPSEADSTYVGITSSDGVIPENGAVVINIADVFPVERFQGPARGAIRVIVSAPNSQIQGLYQIVNPARGTLSNHVMVRPGSN